MTLNVDQSTLPVPGNTTADIYRSGNAPPGVPDIAGASIILAGDWQAAHLAAVAGSGTVYRWTHVALVALAIDVRDDYQGPPAGPIVGQEAAPTSDADALYIPDKNGVRYYVVFVERVGYGTGRDHKRVYLQRSKPTWPTNYL